MKMYDYLVSYNFNAEGYLSYSTGTMQVSRKKKLNSFEELDKLVKFIENEHPEATNLTVYNFILLGRNKH